VMCTKTSISFETAHASQKQDKARKMTEQCKRKVKRKKENSSNSNKNKKSKKVRLAQTTVRAWAKKEMSDSQLGKDIPARKRKKTKNNKKGRKREKKKRIAEMNIKNCMSR
jgi:hypothetical protein